MSEVNIPTDKNASSHKNAKKRSTNVDLTPMVDLGFLLITFFVFSSTISQPTVMSMNEPKEGDTMPVRESGAMTILLGKDHQLYYYFKTLEVQNAGQQIKPTDFKHIRQLILDKKNATPISDLMFIIKPDKESTFKDAVDILDEMSINNVPPGHYTETDIDKAEVQWLSLAERGNDINE